MDDHAPLREPFFPRNLPKFDEPADPKRIDRDRLCVPHEVLPASELEYTTEWQVEPWGEAVPSR